MFQQTLQQAVQLHQAGRLGEAEQLYAQLLSQQPDLFEALHLMGLLRSEPEPPGRGRRLHGAGAEGFVPTRPKP